MTVPAETPRGGVGGELRAARERLGWSLEDVSACLRIRLKVLQAIEAGRFGELPAGVYALGFARSYAKLLGLDAEEVARRFRSETSGMTRPAELQFPTPVAERAVPAGAVVLVGAVLAIGAYAGWYRMSGEWANTNVVQTVPERLAPLAEPPPLPAAPAAVAALVDALPALPSYPPISAGAAMPPASFVLPPPLTAPPAVPMPAPAAAGAAAAEGKVVLRATADSWVLVRDRSGQTLLNRVMRAGETYSVPPKPQLLLTVGNAGGLDLLVDGAPVPSLGGPGVVRRDLPLDPDLLRARPAAARPLRGTQ